MNAVHADRVALRVLRFSGQHCESALFNSHSVQSYALARIKTDWLSYHWGAAQELEPKLLAFLKNPMHVELMGPGGAWRLFVDEYIAQDSADSARVVVARSAIKEMEAAADRKFAAGMAALRRAPA